MRGYVSLSVAALLGLSISTGALAQDKKSADIDDEIKQADKAARVFTEIMGSPDKGIQTAVLKNAECVAVFPNVLGGAFGVGGRGGRGVGSCRTASGWSAPAYFNLGGGSVGFQIGVESTDLILLFMNRSGMDSLLSSKVTLGADASVAAGPVGREAAAATDVKFNAQILTYSRSKGLFAGVALKGAAVDVAGDDMRDVYGSTKTAKQVLQDSGRTAPSGVQAFPNTLERYSARRGEQ
jgi:lipid-binding SYLF domain-containing protein